MLQIISQRKKEGNDMYLVLDTFNAPVHSPMICVNEDGETLTFSTYEEADAFGQENCQEYQVIKVDL
jgi:hypothetical protein